jgi:hypothetical protein
MEDTSMSNPRNPRPKKRDAYLSSNIEWIQIPYEVKDPELWREATRYQFIYSLAGLVLGLTCIIGGIILFLHGVTGSTSWTAKVIGLESNISDAAPGAVLFIVGLFIVFITRFVVKTKRR